MRVLYWIILGLAALALALFAASNRTTVALGLWPFGLALELPLYLAILLTFLAGFLCGALAAWFGGRHWRREARQRRRRVIALESELEATQAQLAEATPPAASTAPSGQELAPPKVPPPTPADRPARVAARG
ncbi:MAG: LapA family protein [Alphaproteobacteria bacterium]